MKKLFLMGALAAAMILPSQAATVLIQGTGMDYIYNGTNALYDATNQLGDNGLSTQADPLASLTTTLGFAAITNIFVDFNLNLATPLVIGGPASTITGGFFDILNSTPGTYMLRLSVTGGTVLVTNPGTLSISANATANGVGGNSFGVIGPYTITFSSQNVSGIPPAENLGRVTATGSFDISAQQAPVPEPSTYAMLGGALVGVGLLRRRMSR